MKSRLNILVLTATLVLVLTCSAVFAIDGVTLIDQARALAGGVTPDDTPGFPVTISQAGSYRLSGNLTVPDENTTAIEVTTDNVSIDLNGFAILGPTVTGTGSGIFAWMSFNLNVSNGTITGMGRHGIRNSLSTFVSNVRVISNGASGITIGNGILTGNYVAGNGEEGIQHDGSVTVTGNQVNSNGWEGLWNGSNLGKGTISGNTFYNNGKLGIRVSGYVGYYGNTFYHNNGGGAQISGGVNLGNNLCETVLCP